MRLIVTGGAGFIGSNLVQLILNERPTWQVVVVDALTYAGNLENLAPCEGNRNYYFVHADITDIARMTEIFEEYKPEAVLHLAAESHVDRSVVDPMSFVRTNIFGTQVLLDLARNSKDFRFVHISTDEVYGSLGADGKFSETTPLAPNSPYSASKASSDLLVRAAYHTHHLDIVITRCSNNYGPWQFPEKLIPLMLSNAIEDKPLPVYGDGLNVRDWLYVEDHCHALIAALERGRSGEVYNVGGNNEWTNIDIVRRILELTGKNESLIRYVTDRPGHDRRYAIDATKIAIELGWEPKHSFETALPLTINWYKAHWDWLDRVRSGAYRDYYQNMYGARLAGS